ncbi:MAG: UDP-N-acetylmuramoyl-L-alanine--D-glutamate ligase [Clostridiales bacterium]|nr:MAG: UDP-N-acetylmuramoyl-L-alanine--D-glutamate ligase [Clostridiales bacterium]
MAKKALIIGAARSGLAAAAFLAQRGTEVVLTDTNEKNRAKCEEELKDYDITYIWGEQPDIDEIKPDFLVMSPGVPLTIAPVKRARELNIPLTGEIELAYQNAKAPIVAITGTNGKTTTTTLVGEIFKAAGMETGVGGNIGTSLLNESERISASGVLVAEISSFQLETADKFKPKAAAILNLTPDHLDRHGDMAGYLAAKAKIFAAQDENDYLILNYDDEYLRPLAAQARGQVLFFSRKHILESGVYVHDDIVCAAFKDETIEICRAEEIMIKGAHNLENAMAAAALCLVMGIKADIIAKVLKTFPGVEHRLEPVRTLNGVLYVNDSKGTNPDSTAKALEAYDRPLVLIAGGKGKGVSFLPLAELIKKRVKAVVLVGMAKYELKEALDQAGFSNYVLVDTFEQTVPAAQKIAQAGDIVLLSPACTSWDMFNSYEERGELFKKLVNAL